MSGLAIFKACGAKVYREETSSGAVQIGNPIEEKKLTDALIDDRLILCAADGGGLDRRGVAAQFRLGGAPPPPQDLEDVPETQLNLKLKGTIAASVDQESMAIIAEGNGDEKVYEIGDAIPGGASIHAIRLDRVILERAGRLEELRLAAVEGRLEAELAAGRHDELVGELRTLVGEHPLRERLWALLIVALYRSDRQAEARCKALCLCPARSHPNSS